MSKEVWVKLGLPDSKAGELTCQGFVGRDRKQGPPFRIPMAMVGQIPKPPAGWCYKSHGYTFLNEAIQKFGGSWNYGMPREGVDF